MLATLKLCIRLNVMNNKDRITEYKDCIIAFIIDIKKQSYMLFFQYLNT